MYTDDQRFVWDIDSLREINKNPTQKNLVDATVFLRRLLTDSAGPLLISVARGRNFKPLFTIPNTKKFDEDLDELFRREGSPQIQFHWRPVDEFENGHPNMMKVGLDDFLGYAMGQIKGEKFTVKQIIKYVANVGGGVHKGLPRNKDNANLIHENSNFTIENFPFPVASIYSISKATTDALMPLYLRIRS